MSTLDEDTQLSSSSDEESESNNDSKKDGLNLAGFLFGNIDTDESEEKSDAGPETQPDPKPITQMNGPEGECEEKSDTKSDSIPMNQTNDLEKKEEKQFLVPHPKKYKLHQKKGVLHPISFKSLT